MTRTERQWAAALEALTNSGLGSSTMATDQALVKSATEKTRDVFADRLADAMRADKWPDTDPRSHLETIVSDMTMDAIEKLMDAGVGEDEAAASVGEFMDAHVLAGNGEDEIVDNAADRLSDSHAYSRDAASYFGHGHDDF